MRIANIAVMFLIMPFLLGAASNVTDNNVQNKNIYPAISGKTDDNIQDKNTHSAISGKTDNNIQDKNTQPAIYIHKKNEYAGVTDEPNIMKALDLMVNTKGDFSRKAILGNNLSKKPMKISFKDLSTISPKYASFDALGWKVRDRLNIFINIKHKNTPPEALASLLSHEALHQDEFNSLDEETYCWTMEATVWLEMKKRNPELNNLEKNLYSLVDRENSIGKMLIDAKYTDKEIRHEVETNPGYVDLPKRSPGFEDDN